MQFVDSLGLVGTKLYNRHVPPMLSQEDYDFLPLPHLLLKLIEGYFISSPTKDAVRTQFVGFYNHYLKTEKAKIKSQYVKKAKKNKVRFLPRFRHMFRRHRRHPKYSQDYLSKWHDSIYAYLLPTELSRPKTRIYRRFLRLKRSYGYRVKLPKKPKLVKTFTFGIPHRVKLFKFKPYSFFEHDLPRNRAAARWRNTYNRPPLSFPINFPHREEMAFFLSILALPPLAPVRFRFPRRHDITFSAMKFNHLLTRDWSLYSVDRKPALPPLHGGAPVSFTGFLELHSYDLLEGYRDGLSTQEVHSLIQSNLSELLLTHGMYDLDGLPSQLGEMVASLIIPLDPDLLSSSYLTSLLDLYIADPQRLTGRVRGLIGVFPSQIPGIKIRYTHLTYAI